MRAIQFMALVVVVLLTEIDVHGQDQTSYFLTTHPGETYNLLRCPASTNCALRASWTIVAGPLQPAQIPILITHPPGKFEYSWETCIGSACAWRSWEVLMHDSARLPVLPISVGRNVRVTLEAAVRSAPGVEPALGLQPIGAQGVVTAGPSCCLWGNTWWTINFLTGADGWVTSDRLQVVP